MLAQYVGNVQDIPILVIISTNFLYVAYNCKL